MQPSPPRNRMLVIPAAGRTVKRPRPPYAPLSATEPTEITPDGYYQRCIAAGDLLIVDASGRKPAATTAPTPDPKPAAKRDSEAKP